MRLERYLRPGRDLHALNMKLSSKHGQTAIEYLLVVLISITILTMVFLWTQTVGHEAKEQGETRSDEAMCDLVPCENYDPTPCLANVPPCRNTSICDSDNTCKY